MDMKATHQESPPRRMLQPAGLVDSKLDHLERMIRHMTRADADGLVCRLDHEYWEKRIRTLVETHDLVAIQRHRVIRLLDLLERQALFRVRDRTAA
jgi:hypothetical protein